MNNQQPKRILREGLRPLDLEGMVHDLFEIDVYNQDKHSPVITA